MIGLLAEVVSGERAEMREHESVRLRCTRLVSVGLVDWLCWRGFSQGEESALGAWP